MEKLLLAVQTACETGDANQAARYAAAYDQLDSCRRAMRDEETAGD